MKAWEKKLVPISFVFVSVLFLLVAVVKPVIKGQPLNVAFLAVGVLGIVLGLAAWRKSGDASGPPSA